MALADRSVRVIAIPSDARDPDLGGVNNLGIDSAG
jgi:hypothetical protein